MGANEVVDLPPGARAANPELPAVVLAGPPALPGCFTHRQSHWLHFALDFCLDQLLSIFTILGCFRCVGVGCVYERALLVKLA